MPETEVVCAIFYTHQTSGTCAGMIVYNQMHQMEKTVQVVLDGKSSKEYPVYAGVPQASILGPTLF